MAPIDWWPFLILVFFIGLLARVHPLTAIAVMLMLVSLAARWWTRRALNGVVYRRRFVYDRGYPGETLDMTVEAENRKFLPVAWLRAIDTLPTLVGPEDESLAVPTHIPEQIYLISLYSLRWWERDRRTYRLLLRQRGVYRLGPARLESGDLFGVFETARDDERLQFVTVFPQALDFESLALSTSDPFGDRAARRRLFEDPTRMQGVREYQPEDDFRRIHWPATARTGELQVKVFQPVSARVMVVCLNVMTMPRYYQGTDPEMLEHLVRVGATVAERGLADGYQVGLIANTSMAHADQPFRIPPGRSPGQHMQLLTALAGVTQFSTGMFDRFLMAEAPRLPYGATLVVITGPMSLELRQVLMSLRGRARRVLALTFEERKPLDIPGVEVVHRPFIPKKAAP